MGQGDSPLAPDIQQTPSGIAMDLLAHALTSMLLHFVKIGFLGWHGV